MGKSVFNFKYLDLRIVSDFGFRISNFQCEALATGITRYVAPSAYQNLEMSGAAVRTFLPSPIVKSNHLSDLFNYITEKVF